MQVVAGVVLLLEFSLQFFSLPKKQLFFFLLMKSVCLATNKKLVFFSIKYYCLVEAGASNMVFGHVCRFFVSRKSYEKKSLTKSRREREDEKNLFVFIWLLCGVLFACGENCKTRYELPKGTTTVAQRSPI